MTALTSDFRRLVYVSGAPGSWTAGLGGDDLAASPGPQPQRWDIDAAQPGRATASMAHGCRCHSYDGP